MPSWSARLFPAADAGACARRHRLAGDPTRAEAARGDAGAALAGASGRACERLQLHAVASFTRTGASMCRRRCGRRMVAGEKLFVDWAGDTIAVVDPATGRSGVRASSSPPLGASNFTFGGGAAGARRCRTDRCARAMRLRRSAGCRGRWCPTISARRHDPKPLALRARHQSDLPGLGRSLRLRRLPTRIRHPRDKAKVEVAVQIVERFVVLAKLRTRTFFSLAELNAAIRDCVAAINAKIMRHIGKSRAELLEVLDRPALKALPTRPYAYAEWQQHERASRPTITSRAPGTSTRCRRG